MKTESRNLRHARVRAIVHGTAERPRLVVFRGTKTLGAQLVDDVSGKTLASRQVKPATVAQAAALGTEIAKAASAAKVNAVVFDRAGYQYHGIVKAVADAARENGLQL